MSPSGLRIAIQGVRASFHDVAAREFFGDKIGSLIECASFPALGKALRSRDADLAVMAIENTIAGSILPNYSLMESHRFKILGEVFLPIEMNLMALPGQTISEIHTVQSHPMALLQCEDFLLKHPQMKVVEGTDTAESARDLKDKKLTGQAAIASRLAAETFGLELLAESIQSNSRNMTRFLVLSRETDYQAPAGANKCTVRFEAPDRPGALIEILKIFESHSINMTKLQSVVIPGRPYEYGFHVDLEWKDPEKYHKAMLELPKRALHLIHFGEYIKGKRQQLT